MTGVYRVDFSNDIASTLLDQGPAAWGVRPEGPTSWEGIEHDVEWQREQQEYMDAAADGLADLVNDDDA